LSARLKVEDLALAERRIGNLNADLQWDEKKLAVQQFDLATQGGNSP